MLESYEMWFIFADGTKLPIPVLPEQITLKYGTKRQSVNILYLGEIFTEEGQSRPAVEISFDSIFPGRWFPGVMPYVYDLSWPPAFYDSVIRANMYTGTSNAGYGLNIGPLRLVITGMGVNMMCLISDYTIREEGGDPGTIHYSITLKEYREAHARQVSVDPVTKKASLSELKQIRYNLKSVPGMVEVKAGQSMLSIVLDAYGGIDGIRSRGLLGTFARFAAKNANACPNPLLINKGMKLYFG